MYNHEVWSPVLWLSSRLAGVRRRSGTDGGRAHRNVSGTVPVRGAAEQVQRNVGRPTSAAASHAQVFLRISHLESGECKSVKIFTRADDDNNDVYVTRTFETYAVYRRSSTFFRFRTPWQFTTILRKYPQMLICQERARAWKKKFGGDQYFY